MTIEAVVFDVGETLVDETRMWGLHADRLGVSRLTFFAALGTVIDRGQHHRRVFDYFDASPMTSTDLGYRIEEQDLYPDAAPCLIALRNAGFRIGIAGNQPETTEAALASLNVAADFIASSARWGVEKPSPAFFRRTIETAGVPAGSVAYDGDRLDNDVLPARASGMVGVFIKRGPWGVLHAGMPEANQADITIDRLDELPAVLAAFRR